MTFKQIPTLDLTRNGALEIFGQSHVLAYLRSPSRDYSITLITYEKEEDRGDRARMTVARVQCETVGITWLPQRFRYRLRIIVPALGMMRMARPVRRAVKRGGIRLIHPRSCIRAAVALLVSGMTRPPLIFDTCALWPEELITADRMRGRLWLHKAMSEIPRWGRPVVANEGVGDVARNVRNGRVIVLVRSSRAENIEAAWEELHGVLAIRCSRVAEAIFSLATGPIDIHALHPSIPAGGGH